MNEYQVFGRDGSRISAARRALERAERELRARPESANAAIMTATILAGQGDAHRASELIGLALTAEPDDPRVLFNAACTYATLGDVAPAIAFLEKVLPMIPAADQA